MFIIKEGTAADKVGEGTTAETISSINKFLETQGYTIRNAEQDTSFTQKKIDEAFYKRNNQLEQTIKEVTGIEPKAEEREKYFDFLKRAVTEKISGSSSEVQKLQAKIADLEKGGGNATAIDEYKRQLQEAQTAAATGRKELEDKIKKLEGDIFMGKVSSVKEKALSNLKAKLKKMDFQDDVIAARLIKFDKENVPVEFDGQIIFKDDKGNTRNAKLDGKPMNAEEILATYLDDLIDKDRKAGGAGSGGGAGAGAGAGGAAPAAWKSLTIDKAVVKDKAGLYTFLKNTEVTGLTEGTKEFNEAYAGLEKDFPLRPRA